MFLNALKSHWNGLPNAVSIGFQTFPWMSIFSIGFPNYTAQRSWQTVRQLNWHQIHWAWPMSVSGSVTVVTPQWGRVRDGSWQNEERCSVAVRTWALWAGKCGQDQMDVIFDTFYYDIVLVHHRVSFEENLVWFTNGLITFWAVSQVSHMGGHVWDLKSLSGKYADGWASRNVAPDAAISINKCSFCSLGSSASCEQCRMGEVKHTIFEEMSSHFASCFECFHMYTCLIYRHLGFIGSLTLLEQVGWSENDTKKGPRV